MKVFDVTADELQDYEEKLHAASTASADAFEKLARAQNLPTLEHDARKSAIYHAANDTVSTFSDATGKIACDFFDAHVEGATPSEIPPQPKYIKQRLYEHIEEYEQAHELGDDEFLQLMSQDVYTEVYHHANRTTMHNAIKNKLRYARVPMGNACAFCLMLATRGFTYYTRTSAGEDKGHYHVHCHCKIVAGTKNTKVAGYDPDGLNKRIKQVADSLGIQNFSWKDCMNNSSIQYRLQEELQFRDKDWVLTGKPPEIDYSKNPRQNYGVRKVENNDYSKENFKKRHNEWRDLFVHDTLAQNGYKVQPQGGSDIDLRINGQLWEVKSPMPMRDSNPDSLRWIENNVKAANAQFRKRGINGETSLILSGYYYAINDAIIEKELVKRARQHKVKRVIFIDKTGNIKRLI